MPVILAAGRSARGNFLKPLARFGDKSALEIAMENCAGLARPVVVLGHQAAHVRRGVPRGVSVVVNRRWRAGQLSSLLAGLRHVPAGAAFMLYPVDFPLLTRTEVLRLTKTFRARRAGVEIAAPVVRRRSGHPVLFSPAMRAELKRARTAKEVVFRDRNRLRLVPVDTAAIWQDFRSPASYHLRLRAYVQRRR